MQYLPHLIIILFFGLLTQSCNKEDEPPITPEEPVEETDTAVVPKDTVKKDTVQKQPEKTRTEILAKKWIVDEAYVNGSTPDNSSKGLTLDVRADGTYTLSTGYIGTWEFLENESKILWDKDQHFKQTFTLDKFEEDLIDATFISGFTQQRARWVMIPF